MTSLPAGDRGQRTGNRSRLGEGTHPAGPGQTNKGRNPRVPGRTATVVQVSDKQRLGAESSWGIGEVTSRFTWLPTQEGKIAHEVLRVDMG